MSGAGLSRRRWLGLGALSLGAYGLGSWMRRGWPLGEDISDRVDVAAIGGAPGYPSEGRTDAPLILAVFSDYACGVCREAEPRWRAAVRQAGDVRVVHRDWPILGPQSFRAARVALAAHYQALYARFHAALMHSGTGLGEGALRGALEEVGGNWVRLESDLALHAAAIDALLARTARDAFRLGFQGTPGYLIGPMRIAGGASERQFADAIERARR